MTIKHLAYRIAHNSALGIASLAEAMGLSAQTLTNFLNVNSDTHNLHIARFEMLVDFANGNLAVAEFFGNKANAAVVPLPTNTIIGDMNLLDAFLNAGVKSGSFDYEFKKAWDDGRIDAVEFARLKQLNLDLIGARLALIAQLEQVVQ